MRMSSSASRRPTIARSTSARIRSPSAPTSSIPSSRLEPLTCLDRLADRVRRETGPERLEHLVGSLAHELVGRLAERGARGGGVPLEIDAVPLEALDRDVAQDEPEPLAVRGAREGEVELPLEPLEL